MNLTAKEAAEALANGELDKVLEGTEYGKGETGLEVIQSLMAADRDRFTNAAKVQVLQLALAEAKVALVAAKGLKEALKDGDEWDTEDILDAIQRALETIAAIAATQPKESQS